MLRTGSEEFIQHLVVLTQKVDAADSNLGVTLHWLRVLAEHCDRITVVALKTGEYDLPSHVTVRALAPSSRSGRLLKTLRLWRYILPLAATASGLLVHQVQLFALLAGPWFRLAGKPVLMWKTHGHPPWTMRLALTVVDRVLTASEASFPLETPRKTVIGHGIDTDRFDGAGKGRRPFSETPYELVHAGRISPTKRVGEMVRLIRDSSLEVPLELHLYGESVREDEQRYERQLRLRTRKDERIHWHGPRPYSEMPRLLCQHDLFLNFSQTDSVDKSVLEAFALSRPVLTTNPAFQDLPALRSYPYYTGSTDPRELTRALQQWSALTRREMKEYGKTARDYVVENHSLPAWAGNVMRCFEEVGGAESTGDTRRQPDR